MDSKESLIITKHTKSIIFLLIILTSMVFGVLLGYLIFNTKQESIKIDVRQNQSVSVDENATNADIININTASIKELSSLPSVGTAKANAIIKNRPYNNKSELLNVISEELYNKIKGKVCD